jgi:hypothetical protein
MANAHALEENTRDVIDPLISKKRSLLHQYFDQLRSRFRSDLSRLAQGRMAMGIRAGQGCTRSYSSAPGSDRRSFHAAVQA